MEGKGASVGPDAWAAKRIRVELGRRAPLRPTTHSLTYSLAQVTPDGSRSAGHAGPFTESRVRLRVRCQPIGVHISGQQVLTACSCPRHCLSILLWRSSSRKCVSTLGCCMKLRFCVMLEDVRRGHVRTRPLPLSGPTEKLFVTSENLLRLDVSASNGGCPDCCPIFQGRQVFDNNFGFCFASA